MSKPKTKYTLYVKRDHYFTAEIKADSLEEALTMAKSMTIDALVEAPGDTIDDEHRITGVVE